MLDDELNRLTALLFRLYCDFAGPNRLKLAVFEDKFEENELLDEQLDDIESSLKDKDAAVMFCADVDG